MKPIITLLFTVFSFVLFAQNADLSEAAKAAKLETIKQMVRTKELLIENTKNLSQAQWQFKEAPNKWSIAEVVEHLAIWEVIWAREISIGLRNKPSPELAQTSKPDSYYHEFIMEEKGHDAPEIAKPSGKIAGNDALNWFLRMRDENIKFAENIKVDMREYYEFAGTPNPRNMYQVYIYQWGHIDRHVRQIMKVKTHANYPK